MPVYEYRCANDHTTELIRPYSERAQPAECRVCGSEAAYGIYTAPRVNDTKVMILSYPGSKKLKAGYVHSHGDMRATRTQSGYGGTQGPKEKPSDDYVRQNFQVDGAIPESTRIR